MAPPPGPSASPARRPPALLAAQSAMDRRLIALVEGLAPGELSRIVTIHRGQRDQRERLDRLLLHLFQHQIHHRGQAHAMLSGTAIAPPQLDEFYAGEEAPLRAADFAALGWREEEIWPVRG
ncbi:DinB family protein [Pseudoroseomonas cervicalis]|uniref:DinB family protein n=1 Tax=Teichococcus cervicalis TaxID=204525 RepID=UPI00277FC092|nr:DinB family protein [Pseudoroseomonas cervicalis]MDQ1080606.1 putative damage-inducible protein DinB [Pseudoroseomonas cervicalis]